jgi:hypothetical protein
MTKKRMDRADLARPMLRWAVIATRTTTYEIDACTRDDAIDGMINGQADETDQRTTEITARVICPACKQAVSSDLVGAILK